MQSLQQIGKVPRFAVVGIAATLIYALAAICFSWVLPPAQASVLAYTVAAVFSYCGHKYLTFASSGAHQLEAPRFILLTLTGIAISWSIPWIAVDGLGLPAIASVALVCLIIPGFNYLVLDRWVFHDQR